MLLIIFAIFSGTFIKLTKNDLITINVQLAKEKRFALITMSE